MSCSMRQFAALVATYAIVLQSLLLGLVFAAHVRFETFAVICSSNTSRGHEPSIPRHSGECDPACLAACNDSPTLPVASIVFSMAPFAKSPSGAGVVIELPSLQSRHQPQESRAPPIAS
jgi:hypothetical protein